MAAKLPILPQTRLADDLQLRAWLIEGIERKLMTRRQMAAARLLIQPHLPCTAELLQRSPKSVIYVHVNLSIQYRIGQRAQMHGAIPEPITD